MIAAEGNGSTTLVTAIPFLVAVLLVFAMQVALLVLKSVAWTLFWRRLTGNEAPFAHPLDSPLTLAEEAAR